MAFRVLVVGPAAESKTAVERVLADAGNFVTSVSDFQEAKQRLLVAIPDLLVTSLKLGAYNGIQLVLRAHADDRSMPAIVMHDSRDSVLEREAAGAGAAYVTTPIDEESFAALVDRLLTSTHVPHAGVSARVPRKWPRKKAAVQVDVNGDTATVLDVSYGGLLLELSGVPDETLAAIETVAIPTVGTILVHPVWARGGAVGSQRWWCGAELDFTDEAIGGAWRRFVDSFA
jgi:CheY-like chemotaxis protein